MSFRDIIEVCFLGLAAAITVVVLIIACIYIFPSDNANTIHKLDYLGADGHHINLTENSSTTDVTYDQLIKFLDEDKTDQMQYNGTFQCADFAEMLHNNAEAAGINCGFTAISFKHGIGHACNVFDTTDRGLIFIDDIEADKIVTLQVDADYVPVSLWNKNKIYEPVDNIQSWKSYW